MREELVQAIQTEALRLGFSACGFAKAGPVDDDMAHVLDRWTANGYHADMGYMERNRHLRLDPTQLVPGCRTLIVTALNYYPGQPLPHEGYQIAYYAYGKDYHRVVKDKLHQLLAYIKTLVPETEGRAFCDTAPLLERYWAVKAGLGFIGRNRQLIIPGKGSYFFLGVLAINLEAPSQPPPTGGREAPLLSPQLGGSPKHDEDTAGSDTPPPVGGGWEGASLPPVGGGWSGGEAPCLSCNRCLKACPTGALTTEGIDCRRCLSYLTIEHRGEIPDEMGRKMGRSIYGCDICQQVCPHNKNAHSTKEKAFDLSPEVAAMSTDDWDNLTKEQYKQLFKESAMERAGYEGLKRNIKSAKLG